MKTVTDFPRKIVEFPDMGIVMPDGCRLSARVWMPEDAAENPVPAILEHLPYRKRDGTTARDSLTHPYLAGHGYACIRVDMRGNGDSEGLMEDEYSEQELQDAVDVIAWLAAQPWCSGTVGMMGISWGGFNALQVAAKQPPALKAIVTLCSTDDRYADDIHYKGGLLLNENMGWGATMLSYSSRPPDPALVGERWREMWLERLRARAVPAGGLAEAPAPRLLLEARLGLRGFLDDQGRDARHRRLGRRLQECGVAPGRRNFGAGQGHRRPVDPQISAFRRAQAGDRLPAGGAALVGPLAEGHRHRRRATTRRCGST